MARTATTILQGSLLALALMASLSQTAAAQSAWLPLGDGHISKAPERGSVFVCQTRFGAEGGAFREGDWIRGDKWNPDLKPTVDGSVSWPNAKITFSLEGNERVVSSNGLPTHPTGEYPVRRSDDAYSYDRNPNRITERTVLLRLPAMPKIADRPSCVPMGLIGVAVSGAAIFNALDGLGRDAAAHEILDMCGGHPERSGQYHYHGPSPCTAESKEAIGYALDGFGIYSVYGEDGEELTDADLDECHGHVATVMWNGRKQKIYHYHWTHAYPYSIACFKGTPVSLPRGPGGGMGGNGPSAGGQYGGQQFGRGQFGGQQGGQFGGGRQGAQQFGGRNDPLAQAAAELGVDVETLRRAVGPPPPDIDRASRILGIDRNRLREVMERYRPR